MEVSCDKCGRGYRVKPELTGRAVKCKACGNQFTIPQPDITSAPDPVVDLSSVGDTPAPFVAASNVASPLDEATAVEGPNDKVMRLISVGLFFAGLLLLVVNHITSVMNSEVYLAALGLGPIALMLGLAGVISPNILRSAGKYGKHLPLRYKLAAGVFGFAGVAICLLLVFVVYPLG